ncbi:hypothetical protein BB559_001020 [Furculomyces boomerangus]|uniref:MADS-box domain-containing protein n=2 Tax=Harpellales TaxID=61421 RepID=A0A2T9Z3C7_9FUNG|nr:hypothetical protein BB559_001020 [Furculomyces boomerangus]PWA02964.1 hypothetical protein BB558_000874 [Smittium angustum]
MNNFPPQRKMPSDGIQHMNSVIPNDSLQQNQPVNMIQNGRYMGQMPHQDSILSPPVQGPSPTSEKRSRKHESDDINVNDDSGSEIASKEDMSATPSDKKTRRRKIKIEFIKDKGRRHITFSKRKAGIMKKAFELSTLTGTQVLLLVVSETGLVYTYTTSKLQPIVTKPEGKSLIQTCLNIPDITDNIQSNVAEPNAVYNNASTGAINNSSGPYVNSSRQHSISAYPDNIPSVDQSPFDDDGRKVSVHPNPINQPLPSSNVASDQYFSPYYGGNQPLHSIQSRNGNGPSNSSNSGVYNQTQPFQHQLAQHNGLSNYVGHTQPQHNSYNLQSNGHHASQPQNSSQGQSQNNTNTPSNTQQTLLTANSQHGINFQDIVANPVIPSISGFPSQQNPTGHNQHQLQQQNQPQFIPQSQLYNTGYWSTTIPTHGVSAGTQSSNRQNYSGSLEKL